MKTESGEIKPYYAASMEHTPKFVDGSMSFDLPIERISTLFNVNTYIISQVNPGTSFFLTSDGKA